MYKRIVTKFFWDYCLNCRVCNYGKRVVIELLGTVIKRFFFHILDLNVNEWVLVKGYIYWGYGHMDPIGSILLLLRPWMRYDYIVIQVVCWVELPEQRRL